MNNPKFLLGVAVAVFGLGLLATVARADNHGNHSEGQMQLPAGCDESAVRQCLSPFQGAGVLAPFASGNLTGAQLAKATTENATVWNDFCSSLAASVKCLQPQEKVCFNGSTDVHFTALLSLPFPVPLTAQQTVAWKGFCTTKMYCLSRVNECTSQYGAAVSNLGLLPNFTDPALCRSIGQYDSCFDQDMPGYCHVIPEIQTPLKSGRMGKEYCQQLNCKPLETCRNTLLTAGPTQNGLDDRTCFLYRNFTHCAGDAVNSCPLLKPGQGQAHPSEVSSIVQDACTAMRADGVKAIYTCATFTTCINKVMVGKDTMLLSNICPTVQGVIGCALEAVQSCSGVDAQKKSEFESQAAALAFRARGLGCGPARIVTEKCTDINTCGQNMQLDKGFDADCTQIQTYQSCVGTALQKCNLTEPAMSAFGAVKVPKIGAISSITQKMCNAMRGQTLSKCVEFDQCQKGIAPPSTPGWNLVSGESWCQFSTRIVECSRKFSRTCDVSTELMKKFDGIMEDLLDEGCKNTFRYVRPKVPVGGAQSLAPVPLLVLLVLACLSWL